jgi:DNA-binding transcriptional MerR regulator
MNHTMSLQDCARMLNVQSYKIQYAYAHRRVPEPQLRIAGRRLFTPDDVRRLAKHFGVNLPESEATEPMAEPTAEVAGV